MEKEIDNREIKLQELLETKDFSALNSAEKQRILLLVSREDYILRRQVILQTQASEPQKIVPLPLILPIKENKVMVMPVYQAMLAVAATVIIMWFLKFPFEKEQLSSTQPKVQYVTQTDTIYLDKLLYDTIFKIIEKPTIVEKKVYETRTVVEYVDVSNEVVSTTILNAPSFDAVPDLAAISAEVDGGSSLSNDNTLGLVPDMILRD